MALDTPTVSQLSQVITQVTAPAFSLGAVASFTLVLIARMNRIIDRSQALNAIDEDDSSRAHLRSDIPRLRRRAVLLNKSILFSTFAAITTSVLVIVAFVSAYFNVVQNERLFGQSLQSACGQRCNDCGQLAISAPA